MDTFNLDPRQLARIEAVHRGFLYQHLYAAACLFDAARAGVTHVIVENDEDVELVRPDKRIYVQVKTRASNLILSDIDGALSRFAAIRKEHAEGRRGGSCQFVVVSNSAPGPELAKRIRAKEWPSDTTLLWPQSPAVDQAIPLPWRTTADGFEACRSAAETLPFAVLAPETLVWKIAGRMIAAAGGIEPSANHTFAVEELPALFEQLIVQLQDFPAPPLRYRPQEHEPNLANGQRVRLVVGFSGAGKTSWVSQTALHTTDRLAYYDIAEISGPALANAVARELAARIFGSRGGKLGEILLPGASGTEILFAIGRHLAEDKFTATVVLDNAHRVAAADLVSLVGASDQLQFVLLAQPGATIARIEATLGVKAELLLGWSNETAAAEGASLGCRGDFSDYERLLKLTGGLPLYVQNALKIAADSYEGVVARVCAALEERTHIVETAQELILADVFDTYNDPERRAVAALSLSDVPLTQSEASIVLKRAFDLEPTTAAAAFRRLRTSGTIQIFGVDRFKIHDAMRPLGRTYLSDSGGEHLQNAREAIRDLLMKALPNEHDRQRVFLLLKMFVALGNVKPLVEMATDEIFHELGYMDEITDFLAKAAVSEEIAAEDRFWALDGLVFAHFKGGDDIDIRNKLDRMDELVRQYSLGLSERLAVGMKRMVFAARAKDVATVKKTMNELSRVLPQTPQHLRVAKYNYAHALYELGMIDECVTSTLDLISEYYDLLGLTLGDVMGKNPDKIFPLLKGEQRHTDDLKHLADSLDLQSKAIKAKGRYPGLGPIHAMKFYSMAHSLDSFVRVGQELVDDFVERNDYAGARDVIERNLMPTIMGMKLAGKIIPVRSQYAVVLAYCGAFAEAEAEMARLTPYENGLDALGQRELRDQRALIAHLKVNPPPPQWQMPPRLSGPLAKK
ncbi:ATP-binding protein [Rhizobium leguminosarum]|uniref:ATP-binding protein n=1 Tax=Rhizobium leguminosarum TaxID=384 RepID=UPI0021BC0A4E|nr:ATP-binding protein [Rhizobium leguminosarum]